MLHRTLLAAIALAAFCAPGVHAQILDYSKYPNLQGQWLPIGGPGRYDIGKPWGPGQEAPLTPEYRVIFEDNLKDQALGGQGWDRDYVCQSPGMPRVTNGYGQLEFVITPTTVHFMTQHIHDNRRIFTDGADPTAFTGLYRHCRHNVSFLRQPYDAEGDANGNPGDQCRDGFYMGTGAKGRTR